MLALLTAATCNRALGTFEAHSASVSRLFLITLAVAEYVLGEGWAALLCAVLSCCFFCVAVALLRRFWLWQFDSLSAAAEHMGVAADVLQQQVEQYNAAAAAGTDAFGKKYYPTTIDAAGSVWVGQITPVVHYCMGGVKINERAQVWLVPIFPVVALGAQAAIDCMCGDREHSHCRALGVAFCRPVFPVRLGIYPCLEFSSAVDCRNSTAC